MPSIPIKLVLLGAGGHASVLLECISDLSDVELAGVLDADSSRWGTAFGSVTVLGDEARLPELTADGIAHFAVAVGSAGANRARERLFQTGCAAGLEPLTIVHPAAIIAPSAKLGASVQCLAGVIVNTEAKLEENVLLNSGAIVEHHCRIGAHTHIASGATLCGAVEVGPRVHIGAGALVRQGIRIGADAVVGAGAVVVRDVDPATTVIGNPARAVSSTD